MTTVPGDKMLAFEVGFLGVGNIGRPMAERLIDGGVALHVFDIRREVLRPLLDRGAKAAASPRDLAEKCDIVFLSLPNADVSRDVMTAADGVNRGEKARIVVNTSTIGIRAVREMAEEAGRNGKVLVDCPISGGASGAAAGTLSVMVSGDATAIERVRPYLELWGRRITVAGDKPGAAQALKLTNNALSIVALAATSEAYVMGAKAGLDPEVMTSAINAGSGRNSATEDKFPKTVLTRTFKYDSEMHILMKDMDLAMELGEELGVPMWVCQAARLVFKHAIFADGPHEDVMTIVQQVERAAQFQIPKTR